MPTDAIRGELAAAILVSTELRSMHRLHAVLLVSLGHSCTEVAEWFGDSPRSVERWVHAYEAGGLDGLHDPPHGGRPAALSVMQLQELRSELAWPPAGFGYGQLSWSGKLMALHLERHYGVVLSQRQCLRLLQVLRRSG